MFIDPNYQKMFFAQYAENDYPSERIRTNDRALDGFTEALNGRLGTAFTASEVKEFLETHQKHREGGLPRIGRTYSGPKYLN